MGVGAGQDVGRSCVLVTIGGKNIMFDCGMHMGYNDERRFPDFAYVSRYGRFDAALDCVIISHFHLDHCGALPYFTEVCGYNGPIYMTYPTKAICPVLLEDYRKIQTERKGETNFFTSEQIRNCMRKVTALNVRETAWVDDELELTPYYAGHVLGAAMFFVRVRGNYSVLYTGDYNMTPDRHLGAAHVNEKLRPDLLITESTYATMIRDSKRTREGNFLKRVHKTVAQGGKVLIPVFAVGRAQELCILIETYWERMGLNVPIYFSAGLTERANMYYELFINWTNQKIKNTFVERNMFEFKHIKPFERQFLENTGPMVLFATPGMLHAGTSLDAFKRWCSSELNMCIMPGYCVQGTIGAKVLAGMKTIRVDSTTTLEVRCAIENLSFSAHVDSKGIMQLIQQIEPKNVMLVHGEKDRMQVLKRNIASEFGIPVFDPANGEVVSLNTTPPIPVNVSTHLLKRQFYNSEKNSETADENGNEPPLKKARLFADVPIEGIIVTDDSFTTNNARPQGKPSVNAPNALKLFDPAEAVAELGLQEHKLRFECPFEVPSGVAGAEVLTQLLHALDAWGVAFERVGPNKLRVQGIEVTLLKAEAPPHTETLLFEWDLANDVLAEKMLVHIEDAFIVFAKQ